LEKELNDDKPETILEKGATRKMKRAKVESGGADEQDEEI
jgi:hypothetical protein